MPNWVRNIINVCGDAAEIDAMIAGVKSDDSVFDFNKLIPMPAALQMVSGCMTDSCIIYYLSDRLRKTPSQVLEHPDIACVSRWSRMDMAKQFEFLKDAIKKRHYKRSELYHDGKQYVENFHKYGAITWYKWCCDNWGTKWNACEPEVMRNNPTSCTIYFDTAWSVPEPIIHALVGKYNKLVFEGQWADEDLGNNCGEWSVAEGDNFASFDDKESLEFACEVWGYDYDEIVAEYANYD